MEIVSRGVWRRGVWHKDAVDWGETVCNLVPWVIGAIVVFVLYCVVALIVYATRPSHDVWYSSYDYLKVAGLDTTKDYQLRLGSPTGGGAVGSTETTTRTDFFLIAGETTTTTSGRVVPSSTVRMSFRNGVTNYILEIPYTKVRFHQEMGVKSHVKFTVWIYDQVDKRTQHNVGANFWRFERGHPSREPVSILDTQEWQYTFQDAGLSAYLNKYLAWVDLYVTPAQYSSYLGSLQTAKG